MLAHIKKLIVTATLFGAAQSGIGLAEEAATEKPAEVAEIRLIEHPIAIVSFRERGKEVEGMGGQLGDLLFAKLVADPSLLLVDREDLDTVLAEAELNLSGIVNPQEAIAIGNLTGARLIVTGSVFQIDNAIHVVAKIIGTETSRVVGASVKGEADDELDGLADKLAAKVVQSVKDNSESLVARRVEKADRLEQLKDKLGDARRPAVLIIIEENHVGRTVIDPAAATELTAFCKACGFTVVDRDSGNRQQADYLIQGEGISEFAARHDNLLSVKARLEVKVIDPATGKVVAVDRQTRVAVDLVELIAGKQALQDVAADIAERLLPKLTTPTGTP
jgi:TolB-like protein